MIMKDNFIINLKKKEKNITKQRLKKEKIKKELQIMLIKKQ